MGIPVSVIHPGGIKTDIWESSLKEATNCWKEMGDPCDEVYGTADMSKMKEEVQRAQTALSEPIVVAYAIEHALSSISPKQRYFVGAGAGMFKFMKENLPESLVNRLIYHMFPAITTPPKIKSKL